MSCPRRCGPRLLLALAALAPAAAGGPAQAPRDLELEAPLRNDTFQPVSEEAQRALLEGDRAWAAWRDGGEERQRSTAFEAWRRALELGGPRGQVRAADSEGVALGLWSDPDGTLERRTESVTGAVRRRLAQVGPADREAWRRRFGTLAGLALEAALAAGVGPEGAAGLEAVESGFPGTEAGARASLRLADLALEAGDVAAARGWLGRAWWAWSELAGPWPAALEAREQAFGRVPLVRSDRGAEGGEDLPAPAGSASWRSASTATLLWSETLEGRGGPRRGARDGGLGRWVGNGLAYLDDGSLVVQSASALVRFVPGAPGDPPTVGRFQLGGLVESVNIPYASDSAGGWPMLPAASGGELTAVVGRGRPGGGRGNALLHLDFPDPGAPRVLWRLGPDTWLRGGREGEEEELPLASALLREGPFEFQPGPAVVGSRVLVAARNVGREDDSGRILLLALDRRDGSLVWSREVTRAADLRPELTGLRTFGTGVATPSQPLRLVPAGPGRGPRVFLGTNVGLGNLHDVHDGRLVWSLRSRRRLPEREGWPGSRRPWCWEEPDGPRLAWTPFDSDFLYRLRADEAGTEGLLAGPPLAIGSALGLLAADRSGLVVQARDGLREAVASWPRDGRAALSVALARGERFAGTGMVSAARTWFASDRYLYLLDRERDQALLGSWPLVDPLQPDRGPHSGAALGGGVYGRGDRVHVVGHDTLWCFQVR